MPSFCDRVPDSGADIEAILIALEQHALGKNGVGYSAREGWLSEADAQSVRHRERIDAAAFARGVHCLDAFTDASLQAVVLLAFVKLNAGEQYGVEVISATRKSENGNLYHRLEHMLMGEEAYHSRVLAGATQQFGLARPKHLYKPPLPLQGLIHTLARAPKTVFHPMVLATEIGGVRAFHWLLGRVAQLFRSEPALCEALEARLIEILVDEVGHIAFHRVCSGNRAIAPSLWMPQPVLLGTSGALPEMQALGMTLGEVRSLARLDYAHLPDEVRRRAFFV